MSDDLFGNSTNLDIFKEIAKNSAATRSFRSQTATTGSRFEIPKLPTPSERNEYQSAGRLINRLSERYESWQDNHKNSDTQLAIYAFADGLVVRVNSLSEESFHGIAIEGKMYTDNADCLLVSHQAGLKLLCVAEKITPEKPKRKIGFYTSETIKTANNGEDV